jgi:hypothetical protein
MRMPIVGGLAGACIFAALPLVASSQIITLWDFNSSTPDATSSTGSAAPSIGSGAASAIGGVNATFAAGSPRDDATDNTAWSLAGWPAQGTGSGTAGAQFMVSTVGFSEAIQISFDLRQTTTASERFQLQATSDGINFFDVSGGVASVGTTGNNTGTSFDSSGLFINTVASSSQAFVQSITYSFLADSAFEDNANFGFRLVSVFEGSQYDAAGASANYGTTGTLRLDMVTVSAAPPAVPEPATSAIWMGVCALGAVIYWRHRASRLKRAAPLK